MGAEIIIWLVIATIVTRKSLRNTVVDGWHGLHGRQSPRMERAAARRTARREGALTRYLSELWRDSWDEALDHHRDHRRRRADKRAGRAVRPRGAFHSWADELAQ